MLFSDQSKLGLSGVFERCARSTVVRSAQDVCDVATGSSGVPLADGPVLIITTSSFSFRLVTIFHLDDNDANRHYFVPDGSESSLQEGFAEVANLCCGAVNRAMSELFPHMAMSIPCGLSARCVEHLAQLKPEYTARFGITINDTVKVGVTLCMCCTAPVDIPLTLSNTTQQSSGELEMF